MGPSKGLCIVFCLLCPSHFNLSAASTATTDDSHGYGGGAEEQTEEQQQQQRPPLEETTIPSGPTPPPFRSLHAMGLPDDLWRYHRELAQEAMRQMDPKDPRHKAVPIPFCNAYCLDAPNQQGRSSFGYPSSTFQVTSREDGYLYCLHRFEDVKSVSPTIAHLVSDKWAALEHPGILRLHHCFIAQRAVFFVHGFLKGASSLRDRWAGPLSEPVLWSIICQLVSVIRFVHAYKFAVRTMDLAHVLATMDASQMRLRVVVNCVGIVDALECQSRKTIRDLQQEDIRAFGRLVLSIATGTEITSATDTATFARCEQFCGQNFSRELHSLIFTLIRSRVPPTILDVSRAVAGRALDELDAVHVSLDRTETALAAEYESGRAMRLLLKLGFINERPEFGPNRRWAQSGDCYVLTLFRDYGKLHFNLCCSRESVI
jgi:PAB-dependent poly(A)-specific ribonuclease subunit 3